MNNPTKKIIAREGLILVGVVVVGVFVGLIFPETHYSSLRFLRGVPIKRFGDLGFIIVIFGYPVIRFIIWAIRILMEK